MLTLPLSPLHGVPQPGEVPSAALEEPEETHFSEVQPAPQEASPLGSEAGTVASFVLAVGRFAAAHDARAFARDGAYAARLAHECIVNVHDVDTELGNAGPPVGEATAALHVGRRTRVCAGRRGARSQLQDIVILPRPESVVALPRGLVTWKIAVTRDMRDPGKRGARAVVGHEFNGLTAERVWPPLDDGVWLVGGEAGP